MLKVVFVIMVFMLGLTLWANAQEKRDYFAFDNTLDVLISFHTNGSEKNIIFAMYEMDKVLKEDDDVFVKFNNAPDTIVINYYEMNLKDNDMMMSLSDEDIAYLKKYGIEFFELFGVKYYFTEDNKDIMSRAKLKF